MEKVLFVKIHSLDNEDGCYASNRHFAEFFDVSERQIRTHIGTLKQKGFISVFIQNRNDRVIHTIGKYARVPDAAVKQMQQDHQKLIHRMTLGYRGGTFSPFIRSKRKAASSLTWLCSANKQRDAHRPQAGFRRGPQQPRQGGGIWIMLKSP